MTGHRREQPPPENEAARRSLAGEPEPEFNSSRNAHRDNQAGLIAQELGELHQVARWLEQHHFLTAAAAIVIAGELRTAGVR